MFTSSSEVSASATVQHVLVDDCEKQHLTFGPLVAVCKRYGICRTRAFAFAKQGLLDTFTIGRTRFVYVASVERLPQTLNSLKETSK